MDDSKRQQALDALRNALGRLEQSDIKVYIWNVFTPAGTHVDIMIDQVEYDSSNLTLRLKSSE